MSGWVSECLVVCVYVCKYALGHLRSILGARFWRVGLCGVCWRACACEGETLLTTHAQTLAHQNLNHAYTDIGTIYRYHTYVHTHTHTHTHTVDAQGRLPLHVACANNRLHNIQVTSIPFRHSDMTDANRELSVHSPPH